MEKVKDMTKGSSTKLILNFALPLILANLGQQLYMVIDAMIVGRGVGVKALAAVGATDWTYWLILWVIQALTQGFSTCIAQYFGEKNLKDLKCSIAISVELCIGFGILLTILGVSMASPMLKLLDTPQNIYQGACSYLITMFSGTMIVMAFNMAASILRALGNGRTPMIAMAIAAILNILLDLLLVIVCNLGIIGAAVATLIAQLVAFLYCFIALSKISMIRLKRKDWKWKPVVVKKLCNMGLPLGLQHVMIAVGGMILQSTINEQGFLFVAGFTATNKVYGLLESSAVALGYAVTTYTAQNYGAGLKKRICQGIKSSVIIGILMSICISAFMIIFGKHILSLFISASDYGAEDALKIAYHLLFIMSSLLSSLYLLHIFRNLLQGMGNAIAPMVSGLVEFFMRVLIATIFIKIAGQPILFFAETSAWIGAALVSIIAAIWKLKTYQTS